MRATPARPPPTRLLYVNVLLLATCGLIYELLAGTLGSYLLGDSVTQFSLVIGLYLSAMGVGAWLSKHIDGNLARRFIELELAVALVGGLSAPVLYVAFAEVQNFQVVLLGFVFAIGTLVGLELPLLMRIVQAQVAFKDLVSHVLTFDYAGALFASLLFPLVLVPRLGPDAHLAVRRVVQRGRRALGYLVACRRPAARDRPARARSARDRAAHARCRQGLGAHDLGREPRLRRRDRVRADQRLPAHPGHAEPRGLSAVPERQPAVQRAPTSTAITNRWCTRRCWLGYGRFPAPAWRRGAC